MSEYTQGVCQDGAAILRDGQPMTIEEILEGLRQADKLAEALSGVMTAYTSGNCAAIAEQRTAAAALLTNYRKSKGE